MIIFIAIKVKIISASPERRLDRLEGYNNNEQQKDFLQKWPSFNDVIGEKCIFFLKCLRSSSAFYAPSKKVPALMYSWNVNKVINR